jgi:hypothetical protein
VYYLAVPNIGGAMGAVMAAAANAAVAARPLIPSDVDR